MAFDIGRRWLIPFDLCYPWSIFGVQEVLAQLSKLEPGDPRRPAAIELVTSNFDKFSDNGEVGCSALFDLSIPIRKKIPLTPRTFIFVKLYLVSLKVK